MKEEYRDIKGYEGLYQVSNFGNVKSLPKGDGNGYRTRLLTQEVVKADHTNYRRVTLSKAGKVERFQVHRLVAYNFLEPVEGKDVVNHKDNNGENNYSTNLEFTTTKGNMEHSSVQGRQDLVRSLGGTAVCKIHKEKQDAIHLSRVGSTVGNLTIISFYMDDTLCKPRTKYVCKCTCGNITEKVPYNLYNTNRPQMCNECAYKERKLKDKDIVSTA